MCRGNSPLTPPRRGTRIGRCDTIRTLVLRTLAGGQFPSCGGVRGGSSPSSESAARNLYGWFTLRPATLLLFCTNPLNDAPEHRSNIIFHIIIPETKVGDAERFDFFVSPLVLFSRVVVNRTVHVHGQRQLLGVKIHYPSPERFLPVKVIAAKLLPLELLPKQHFGECHVSTKLACELCEVRTVRNDGSRRLHLDPRMMKERTHP